MKTDEQNNLLPPTDETIKPPRRALISYLLITLGVIIAILAVTFVLLAVIPVKSDNPVGALRLIKQVRSLIVSSERDLKGQTSDRINILLLGIGGEGHDGAFLTDTIIIASIKPSTKQAALVSVPRDLIVPIPGGYGYRKINSADSYGEEQQKGRGAEFATRVVSDVFGMPIHYFARIDFKAFREIIDRIGGVEVYIDRDFTDTMFPNDEYKFRTVSFSHGLQILNGQGALDFARSRHGNNNEGSDFARSRRQQKILLALKDKLLSAGTLFNPSKIHDIIETFNRNISTNIEWWEMAEWYKLGKNLDYENVTTRVLSAENNGPLVESMLGEAFVLQSRDQNFAELRRIVQNIFDDEETAASKTIQSASSQAANLSIFIQNGTWVLGLAAEYKAQMERRGIKIDGVGNAIVRNRKTTMVYGPDTSDINKITDELQRLIGSPVERIKNTPSMDLFLAPATPPDVLIVLGADSDHLISNP